MESLVLQSPRSFCSFMTDSMDDDPENSVLEIVREEIQVESYTKRDRRLLKVILFIVAINLILVIIRFVGIIL